MRSIVSLALVPLLYASVEAQSQSQSQPGGNNTAAGIPSAAPIVGNASTSAAPATASVVNSGSNPLIPTTVSSACQAFLETVNGDTSIAKCTTPLVSTLSHFTPSTSATAYTATNADLTSALSSLCETDACSSSLIRNTLTAMESACAGELQERNKVVLGIYDVLYVVNPMVEAVCTQDSNAGWCVLDIVNGKIPPSTASSNSSTAAGASAASASNSSTLTGTAPSANPALNSTVLAASTSTFDIATYAGAVLDSPQKLFTAVSSSVSRLFRRGPDDAAPSNSTAASAPTNATSSPAPSKPLVTGSLGLLPSSSAWSTSNLPFLFLSSNMTSSVICTSCTKLVFQAYVKSEMAHPYVLGLANSPLLGNQGAIWKGMGDVCGSGFIASIATAAGQNVDITGGATLVRRDATLVVGALLAALFAVLA